MKNLLAVCHLGEGSPKKIVRGGNLSMKNLLGLGWVNYLCFLNGLGGGKDASRQLPV